MFQTKFGRQKSKQTFCVQYPFFFFENRAVYEIMCKKYGRDEQATDYNITQRMRIACWIHKATNTHSEYVILIAFQLLQWLHEHISLLPYRYTACIFPHHHIFYAFLPSNHNNSLNRNSSIANITT